MPKECMGIVVSGEQLQSAHLHMDGTTATLVNQHTWKLQSGDLVAAYSAMYERVRDYVKNNKVDEVVIKASAVGQNRPTLAHLKSAELRGVVTVAAAAGGASTTLVQKGTVSRTFGDRKADEYVQDDSFWKTAVIGGDLTKGRREAALLVLSKGK